ncbi:uroporphyrinogen-III C-methyltransferase [Magnetovibrio sp.]|uniref:uroporphyrinogen-III C-methyltransferase n=1 Tax=Magnetovibrio sp. TaxID=2024836 RepID=UPI002F956388
MSKVKTKSDNVSVFIVGAGPGDPGLLTLKAAACLKKADVVVYDRLVSDEILDMVPDACEKIFAGKAARDHFMPQDEINQTLVDLARQDKTVVRLKGGDPFIFGRGSEEAMFLAEHNIDFEIVPGITASAGCGAYAGIPLTHRGYVTGVRFVTGHCQEGKHLDLNWKSMADPDTTLVIYMGLINVQKISDELIKAGLPADMPAAGIERGTTEEQRTILTTLEKLPACIERAELKAPSLLIIGKVVDLSNTIAWHTQAHQCLLEDDQASGPSNG